MIRNNAQIAMINGDSSGIISVYNSTYTAIYISYYPEYSGSYNDTQLLYNAITYGFHRNNVSQCKNLIFIHTKFLIRF
jgi:hypothetical protein